MIQKIDTSKLASDDNSSVDDSSDDSDTASYSGDSSSGNAFITILSTGAYRIKGTVNEMNVQNIIEGDPVIIRSRVDSSQTWKGTMGTIDRESATSSSNNSNSGMMDSSGDSQTSTSTYPKPALKYQSSESRRQYCFVPPYSPLHSAACQFQPVYFFGCIHSF